MFDIQKIKFNNTSVMIIDKNHQVFTMNMKDPKIASLLPKASNESRKIKKNIRYFEKYFKICLICIAICALGIAIPYALNIYFAEVMLVGFGALSLGFAGLAISSKLYLKWLNKYVLNNKYWLEIYDCMKNNKENIIENNYVKAKLKTEDYCSNYEKQKTYNCKEDNASYHYKANQIIQDYPMKEKVKTYKKF